MEESLTKTPKLELAQLKFSLAQDLNNKEKSAENQLKKNALMDEITKNSKENFKSNYIAFVITVVPCF
jgi:hypothetical protein